MWSHPIARDVLKQILRERLGKYIDDSLPTHRILKPYEKGLFKKTILEILEEVFI